MIDIIDFYEKMEKGKIILSFKGEVTSSLLSSILQMLESKLDRIGEEPKVKKKVYNVLIECLQNLYHHNDGVIEEGFDFDRRSSIFLLGKDDTSAYRIITGNYIYQKNVEQFKKRLEKINSLNKEELKAFYLETLSNEEFSDKGGGGLGMIDIARKSGHKIEFEFINVDNDYAFFTMIVKVTQ
jgi:hypothetical protein